VPSSLGAPEILVILVVALIVLGPKRLPEAGRQIGKAMSEVRRWSQSVQSEIKDVIDVDSDMSRPTYSTPAPVPTPTPAPVPTTSPLSEPTATATGNDLAASSDEPTATPTGNDVAPPPAADPPGDGTAPGAPPSAG